MQVFFNGVCVYHGNDGFNQATGAKKKIPYIIPAEARDVGTGIVEVKAELHAWRDDTWPNGNDKVIKHAQGGPVSFEVVTPYEYNVEEPEPNVVTHGSTSLLTSKVKNFSQKNLYGFHRIDDVKTDFELGKDKDNDIIHSKPHGGNDHKDMEAYKFDHEGRFHINLKTGGVWKDGQKGSKPVKCKGALPCTTKIDQKDTKTGATEEKIIPIPPKGAFNPMVPHENELVKFDFKTFESYLPEPPKEWHIDFGDGTFTKEPVAEHVYLNNGIYAITATASSARYVSSISYRLGVVNVPPVIKSIKEPETITVKEVGHFEIVATDASPIDNKELSIKWNVDGKKFEGSKFSYNFEQPGIITYFVTVSDGEDSTAEGGVVIVTGSPAKISDIKSPSALFAGTEVEFKALTELGDVPIVQYLWELGDGGLAYGENIKYTYLKGGDYTVILTVQNADGLETSKNIKVSVKTPPPTKPEIEAGLLDGFIYAEAIVSHPDASVTLKYLWEVDGVKGEGQLFKYAPSKPGTYTIKLTVTDGVNSPVTATSSIDVPEAPSNTTVLSVDGTVYETDSATIAPNGLLVEVKNLSKPELGVLTDRTGATAGEGRYSVTFISFTEAPVASVGDVIQVAVTDTDGKITRTQFTLTAEEVKAGTVGRDIVLSGISEFTLTLFQGINMISVPLDPGVKWQMSDPATLIGPNLTMIIHYGQVKSGRFDAYKPDFPKTSPANATVKSDQGYIVVMKAPATVTFEGTAWGGEVHLSAGINLISVPVKPLKEMKLSDLLKKIGPDATMAIWYNTEKGKFVTHVPTYPEDSPSNTTVNGGVGYIIMMKKAATVIFEGEAWENTPTIAAPPTVLQAEGLVSAPVLAVEGTVFREDINTALNGIKVTVRNLTANQSATDDTGATAGIGRYIVTFADLAGNRAASIGDVLEASIVDGAGTFEGASIKRMVTQRDIQTGIVSLDIPLSPIPKESALLANYPNPFNPETWIPYNLAKDADVTIKIYNITGQLVKTLELEHKKSGFYLSKEKSAYWNGKNEAGEKVASGIYFYTINAGNFTATKRMILVK